jgi:subtilisin family serine protease
MQARGRRRLLPGLLAALLVAALAAPAHSAPNDPLFSKQWGLTRIQAPEAWQVSTGAGALIAIVDTGVDLRHPDLAAKLVVHKDADFVEPGKAPHDREGHGTHVAGIAGAITNNGIGVAGTAPDAKLLPVRVLDAAGEGTTDWLARGIRYAADKGAHVVNLSLTFTEGLDQVTKITGGLQPVYQAIDYAYRRGAVVVASAGNSSFPLCAEPSAHPRVLCVGATDRDDRRSFYSNLDATLTSNFLVAPGGDDLTCEGDIFSTYLRAKESICAPRGYEALAGTSMAAPFVSGTAALLAAKGLSNDRIVECITSNTDDLGLPGRDPVFGYGRLNALKAVTSC